MTAGRGLDERDVVPRWRPFRSTVKAGELRLPATERWASNEADLAENIEAFEKHPGIHSASDLISGALVRDVYPVAADAAARFILAESRSPRIVRDLAHSLLKRGAHVEAEPVAEPFDFAGDLSRLHRRIHKLRAVVRNEPRNAVRWADLAHGHAILGRSRQAEREIRTALKLAPENRFILRVASSFFVHIDNPEFANDILVKSLGLTSDPWLMSAELATSEIIGKSSKVHRRAARQLLDSDLSPWHLSELASEMATTELRAGKDKFARSLMNRALEDPTENALAQAQWAANQSGVEVQASALDRPDTFEAKARHFAQEGEWSEAVRHGLLWQADQAFSADPAIFTSYTASMGAADFGSAERAARIGWTANPSEPTLVNNLAFALANLGRVDEAQRVFSSGPTSADGVGNATETATKGLIAFRLGRVDEGRRSYEQAIERLRGVREPEFVALAMLLWAREEILAETPQCMNVLSVADKFAENISSPDVAGWRRRVAALATDYLARSAARNG